MADIREAVAIMAKNRYSSYSESMSMPYREFLALATVASEISQAETSELERYR